MIFLFGGNNREQGSLNSIERYSILYDKWDIMDMKLVLPLHDLSAQYLGSGRVMILGGSTDEGPS